MKNTKPFSYSGIKLANTLMIWLLVALIIQSCDTQLDEDVERSAALAPTGKTSSIIKPGQSIGYQGVVYVQSQNDQVQSTVANAILTFSKTDENYVKVTASSPEGFYKITLKPGAYYVTVTANGYNSYSSFPGNFVVTGVNGYQTGNFFLETEITTGFSGVVYDDTSNFTTKLPNTQLTFANANNPSIIYSTFSDSYGTYKINLPIAGYFGKAAVTGYQVYDSTPGIFLCTGPNYQNGNFFLKPL
jgi:hypothetical protein